MPAGVITRLIRERGFGFIKVDNTDRSTKDLFFHSEDLLTEPGFGFDSLSEGDRVEFQIDPLGKKGPRATDVCPG